MPRSHTKLGPYVLSLCSLSVVPCSWCPCGRWFTPADGDIEHGYVNLTKAEQIQESGILTALTAAIEIATESTDLWFTLTTLATFHNPDIFWTSVGILSSQAVLRLAVGLLPLVMFREQSYTSKDANMKDKHHKGRIFGQGSSRKKYFLGLMLMHISPLNGVRVINSAMNLTPPTSSRSGVTVIRETDFVHRAFQLQISLLVMSCVQLIGEDLPEIGVDVWYLVERKWQFSPGELEMLVTTLLLTLISVVRAIYEIRFASRHMKRLPKALNDEFTGLQRTFFGSKVNENKRSWLQRKLRAMFCQFGTPSTPWSRIYEQTDKTGNKRVLVKARHRYYTRVCDLKNLKDDADSN